MEDICIFWDFANKKTNKGTVKCVLIMIMLNMFIFWTEAVLQSLELRHTQVVVQRPGEEDHRLGQACNLLAPCMHCHDCSQSSVHHDHHTHHATSTENIVTFVNPFIFNIILPWLWMCDPSVRDILLCCDEDFLVCSPTRMSCEQEHWCIESSCQHHTVPL